MRKIIAVLSLQMIFLLFTASGGFPVTFAIAGDHGENAGEKIHASTVDGYAFDYTLYDFPERKTHHLMVSITDPGGKPVDNGKVGFLVTGPDGNKQKAMAMGMGGAYGADVDLEIQGMYTIKAKAVVGDKKLFDRFEYEVK